MEDRMLIVDDDAAIDKVLYKVAKNNGFDADIATSGEEALELLSSGSYDIILMDINMNGMDGFETISAIRDREITTPIIIVSGRKDDYDTLYGINIGADDYVIKPFNPVTLGAKIKALVRRNNNARREVPLAVHVGPFSIDPATLFIYKGEKVLDLTAKEVALMKLFMDNANHVITKELIFETVWNDASIDENSVNVCINRLRQKVEEDPAHPQYIKTVRGVGYKLVA